MVEWDQIDFHCRVLEPAEGEPCAVKVSSEITAEAVTAMAKDHFPEGPAAAAAAHEAYCNWKLAHAPLVFDAKKSGPPLAVEGRRWRAFVDSWDNFATAEQWMAGRVHARPELSIGLNLRGQVVKQSHWRDRRPVSLQQEYGQSRDKGRSR